MLASIHISFLLVCSTQLLALVHMLLILEAAAIMGRADSCAIGKEKIESKLLNLKASAQIYYISQMFMYNWPKRLT